MPRYKKTEDPDFVFLLKEEFLNLACTSELALKLDISKKTCQRYLKELNLHYPKGRPKGKKSVNKKTGGLSKWIKTHPGESLPLKVKEIVEQTGLTTDQVKSSLYRLKKRHNDKIRDIGDLRKYKGGLKGTKGTVVLFSDIREYSLKHSPYDEKLKITALLKNKKRIVFNTTLSLLEKYNKE